MYGQYYPGTPNAYNPASPGRPKEEAEAQGSTEEQDGYYQSPGAQPDILVSSIRVTRESLLL